MTDTGWPQWMQSAQKVAELSDNTCGFELRRALLLLAQAAVALEAFADAGNWWVNSDDMFTLDCDMPHSPWLVAQNVLSRIRAGGGGEGAK